jgi:RNA recognition motif-containing protein
MTNIFIANLDWEISSEDLKATFSAFGSVSYAHVVFDRETKKSKGYGYVEMESSDEAIAAIEALKGLEVNGRMLDVKIASPKGSRPEKQEVDLKNKKFQKPFNKNRPQGGGGGFSNRSTGGSGGGYSSGGSSSPSGYSSGGTSSYNKRPRIQSPNQGENS